MIFQNLKILVLLIPITLGSFLSISQNSIVISGEIHSDSNQKALPFATVSIKGKPLGVVSNEIGEFNFKLDASFVNDTLVVSTVGYDTFEKPINQLDFQTELIIKLIEKPFVLGEIVISEEEISALQVIKKAIENIPNNYPQEPYLLEGFYRDYKKENGKYIGLFEAAVSLLDRGYYSRPGYGVSRERVFLNEIRKVKTAPYKSDLYNEFNILERLLAQNEPKYLSNGLDYQNLSYKHDGYTYLDDRLVFVIKTNAPWTSTLYIDTDSYAILKVELDAKWDGFKKNEWRLNDSTMNQVKYVKKTLRFKRYNDAYFPIYMSYTGNIEGIHKDTNEVIFTSLFYQELLINNVVTEEIVVPPKENLMSMIKALDFHKRPYNDGFWANYNIIKDSPLEKDIIKDLNANGKLEEQFEN